jgi:hypothetical protein
VVLIRKGTEPLTIRMPDGFEDLAAYNLISFKSHQETLDGVALDELVGHFMSYWRQVSPRAGLLPVSDFRLFALSARYPREFARRRTLREVRSGVYAIDSFSTEVRIVVVHDLPLENQNALAHLFSARGEALDFARRHYQVRSHRPSALLLMLLDRYRREGIDMPLEVEKWYEQMQRELIENMTPEQRLEAAKKLPPEKRLEGVPPEQLLAGRPLEEQLKAISPELMEEIRRRMATKKPADPK